MAAADVEVVADQVQEGLAADELAGAVDGVAIAERLGLRDERQAAGVLAGGVGVGGLVARADHDADFLDAGAQHFFDDDGEDGFFHAVAVDQGLQRQGALVAAGGGDDGFADLHAIAFLRGQSIWLHGFYHNMNDAARPAHEICCANSTKRRRDPASFPVKGCLV